MQKVEKIYYIFQLKLFTVRRPDQEINRQTENRHFFFLTAIWLSHGQLWAILKGTASLT